MFAAFAIALVGMACGAAPPPGALARAAVPVLAGRALPGPFASLEAWCAGRAPARCDLARGAFERDPDGAEVVDRLGPVGAWRAVRVVPVLGPDGDDRCALAIATAAGWYVADDLIERCAASPGPFHSRGRVAPVTTSPGAIAIVSGERHMPPCGDCALQVGHDALIVCGGARPVCTAPAWIAITGATGRGRRTWSLVGDVLTLGPLGDDLDLEPAVAAARVGRVPW